MTRYALLVSDKISVKNTLRKMRVKIRSVLELSNIIVIEVERDQISEIQKIENITKVYEVETWNY